MYNKKPYETSPDRVFLCGPAGAAAPGGKRGGSEKGQNRQEFPLHFGEWPKGSGFRLDIIR
jgi:hypothetical protein